MLQKVIMQIERTIVEIRLPGQVLSSKIAATILRKDIQAAVSAKKRVKLDCSGVQSINSVFADELIGVLVGAYGPAYVMRNLIFDQAPRHVHISVANAIANSRAIPCGNQQLAA